MPDLARPGLTAGDECGETGALLELLHRRPAWHADGACHEHPDITWFPTRFESDVEAKRICATCLVRPECAEWAASQGPQLHGVWGGISHRQRLAGVTTPTPRPPRPPDRCRLCRSASESLVDNLCPVCRTPKIVAIRPPTGPCVQCGDPTAGDKIHRIAGYPLHATPCYQQVRRHAARTGVAPEVAVKRLTTSPGDAGDIGAPRAIAPGDALLTKPG